MKISKSKYLELRNKQGLTTSKVLHFNIGKILEGEGKSKNDVDKDIPDIKTIDRVEKEGKATPKILSLICRALGIEEKVLLADEHINSNFNQKDEQINSAFYQKIDNIDPQFDYADLEKIQFQNIKKYLSNANKRLYMGHYSKNIPEEAKEKVNLIIKFIDDYSKLTGSFSTVYNQNFNEANTNHLKERSDIRSNVERLLNETGFYLYAAKVKYFSYWPYPFYEYEDYKRNIKYTPFYNDIYYPKKKILEIPEHVRPGEKYEFDPKSTDYNYKIIPIKLHYAVFLFSDLPNIGSITFNTEAGYRITNDINREIGFRGKNDEESDKTLLGIEIKGNYNHALEVIDTNEKFPINYLDTDNIRLIFKETYKVEKVFNIKNYDNKTLKLVEEILNDRRFYKLLFDPNTNKNFFKKDSKENLNYLTRISYLEKKNRKVEFFDSVDAVVNYGHFASINKKNEKEEIFKRGLDEITNHIDFKMEELRDDSLHDDMHEHDI